MDETPPPAPITSYALLSEHVKRHYLAYYKMVFDEGVLDRKTKELIALGAALVTGAPNCIEGHLQKCIRLGASPEELDEVVAVSLGVAGASVVDRADIASAGIGFDRSVLQQLHEEAMHEAAAEEEA
jgi:AhpD family alkylhydroperoxidase